MTDITPPLDATVVEVCSPIFTLLTPLQIPEQADVASEDLRTQVETSFISLERRCFELQLSPEHIRDIKFAMAAFSDEVVMNSRWVKKYDWMAKPLAIEFFGESAIGQAFFDRLETLRSDFDENSEIINLYFSVLALGFQGKYRLSGYEQLQAYIAALRTEIEKYQGKVNRTLADYAAPENQMKSRIVGQQSYWVIAVLFVAASTVMTVVYSSKMQDAIGDSADKIEQMAGSSYLSLPLEEEVAQ